MRSRVVWKNYGYIVMIDCKEEEETRKNAERLLKKINGDSFFDFYSNPQLDGYDILRKLISGYDDSIVNVIVEDKDKIYML